MIKDKNDAKCNEKIEGEKKILKFSYKQTHFSTQDLASFHSQTGKVDIRSDIAIWRAVIMQMILNSTNGSKKPEFKKLKKTSLAWFDINNPYFLEVCSNAHYAPEYVLRKANFAIANANDWKKNCRDRRFRPTKQELSMRNLLNDDYDFFENF
jgi:hypothetical protein